MEYNFIEPHKLVNLFADFLVSEIGHEKKTIIEIIDLENFIVIKGKTNSDEILNIKELKDVFLEHYPSDFFSKRLNNTIDLLEYEVEIPTCESIYITLHNSDNCSFSQEIINEKKYPFSENLNPNKFSYKSSFPHGYSLNQGRIFYYYAKHITYSFPTNIPFREIHLKICERKNVPECFDIRLDYETDTNESIKSAILDSFDFEMGWIEKELKKMDWLQEVINPLVEYEFLKKRNSDFIIL